MISVYDCLKLVYYYWGARWYCWQYDTFPPARLSCYFVRTNVHIALSLSCAQSETIVTVSYLSPVATPDLVHTATQRLLDDAISNDHDDLCCARRHHAFVFPCPPTVVVVACHQRFYKLIIIIR